MVNIALVGVGGFGHFHLEQFLKLSERGKVNMTAAVVRNETKEAETVSLLRRMGCRIFNSLDDLLEAVGDRLDLVSIPTALSCHRPMTEAALKHGINVLVEKPAAPSSEDVLSMLATEKQHGRFVAVGFQDVYSPLSRSIKAALCAGKYGMLRRIAIQGCWPRGTDYYHRNNWAGRLRLPDGTAIFDSPLNNAFAHFLNLALFWCGRDETSSAAPESVEGMLFRARPDLESFDTCFTRYITENHVLIQAQFTHACQEVRNPVMRLECEHATIDWRMAGNYIDYAITDSKGNVLSQDHVFNDRTWMFERIVERVSNPDEFIYTLDNAVNHTRCIEMLHRECTIRTLPPNYYDVIPERGQYAIKGIERTFNTCFENVAFPNDLLANEE